MPVKDCIWTAGLDLSLPLDENGSNVTAYEDPGVPLWCDARELRSVDNDTIKC